MNRDKRVGIMTMTKAGIVNSVYDRLDITKKEAGDYVEAVLDTIKDTLSEGEDIKVSGFGKFEIRAKGERVLVQGDIHTGYARCMTDLQTQAPDPDATLQTLHAQAEQREQERARAAAPQLEPTR